MSTKYFDNKCYLQFLTKILHINNSISSCRKFYEYNSLLNILSLTIEIFIKHELIAVSQ